MVQPATRTVLLRPGMKFTSAVVGTGKKKRVSRIRHVGPCEVQMTETQIKAFKDLLQTAPQAVATEPTEPKPDEPDEPDPDEETERHSSDE